VHRAFAIVFISLPLAVAGCGGSGDEGGRLAEDSVQECLATAGLSSKPPADRGGASGYAPLASAAPDFVLYADDGTSVSVAVHGTDEKAERAAADVNGAIQSLGGPAEAISRRNAVVIFDRAPSDMLRDTVDGCLD
jgi:hypothetical protein